MHEFISSYYLHFKALHIIFVISWMCGLLYLPRIFVYTRLTQEQGGNTDTLLLMQSKLLKIIMRPAIVGSFLFGILLIIAAGPHIWQAPWIHWKLLFVFILAGYHGYCVLLHKRFLNGGQPFSSKYLRVFNEIPAILMIAIVFLVVFKG